MHTVAVQACYSILVACFFLLNVCQLPGDEIPPAESLWTEWKECSFMGIGAQHSRTNALSHGNTIGNTVCCGLYLKCSRAIHHCRCREHAEKRIVPDLESREDNGHQSEHRCRIRRPFRFFLFLFAGSTGW